MTIPKIIHQIWLQGYDQIPTKLKMYHEHCKNINNNFKYIFWDDKKITKLLMENFGKEYVELFNHYQYMAQKADFARYAILYVYGGIYLDMDTMCKKNLFNFLQHKFFFTRTNDLPNIIYPRYQTGIIGSVAKHPIFPIIFQNMFSRKQHAKNVTYSTGTRLFYDSINEYQKNNPNDKITIIDPKYLHPCGIFDDEMCKYTCDECYIAHTNYSSWSPFMRMLKYIKKHKLILAIIILCIIMIIIFKYKSTS